MALSKIWAAFIIISIVVAGVRYALLPADREIFGQMVTGKAGDTMRLARTVPVPAAAAAGAAAATGTSAIPGTSAAPGVLGQGAIAAPAYAVQKADGLIET